MLTRRCFLRASAITVAGMGTAPLWLVRAAAQPGLRRKVLVAIFQRGAADGLNIVVPFFESKYYELRPTIAMPRPGAANGVLDLDGRFGLHPSLQALKPLWETGQLAFVHAAGSPDSSRSHFDAQDYMESGTPGRKTDDGWMNRALPRPTPDTSPLRAVALGPKMPRTLRGDRGAIAVGDPQQFRLRNPEGAAVLSSMYLDSSDTELRASGKAMFEAMRMMESVSSSRPNPLVQYGARPFGRSLEHIARLIKADVGVEAAFTEMGGWDHHSNENPQLANMLTEFGAALAAFVRDMGDRMEDIILVTMSEFGRTVREAGAAGTDHGHGNVMMVLGGPVRGGKVFGRWPGLEPEQLFEQRDLAVTTDFRDVLGELLPHLGHNTAQVFPGHTPGEPLGLLRDRGPAA